MWVRIAESQPRPDQCVLIGNTETGDVGEARYSRQADGTFWFVDVRDGSFFALPEPTHWMPLPEPPRPAKGVA